MQMLPVIGAGLLLAGAFLATFLAVGHPSAEFQLITLPASSTAAGQAELTIDLVPDENDDLFYSAILERPLFQNGRRPIVENSNDAPAEAETPTPDILDEREAATPPDFRLLGVLSEDSRGSAFISLSGNVPQWWTKGSSIAGWILNEIEPDHVIFKKENREHRVDLYRR